MGKQSEGQGVLGSRGDLKRGWTAPGLHKNEGLGWQQTKKGVWQRRQQTGVGGLNVNLLQAQQDATGRHGRKAGKGRAEC
jgi:hypothetical protein